MDPPSPPYSTRLRYAMLRADCDAAALAKCSGVSRSAITALCAGTTAGPGTDTLALLAEALGVAASWLAYGVGDGPDATRVEAAQ